jgi:hypothetical protein
VRKDPELYPNDAPFQLPGEILFTPGDQIHISFISPQRGYLYLINESPSVAGQATSFNTLFPTPTANQGSALLSAGQTFRIPDHDRGFVFDKERGAEKLWLIWAAGELTELENLKSWVNTTDKGEIKDAAQVESLRKFLATHSATQPQLTLDDTTKQTTVKINGDILVKLVKLEHY